ncbi:hypothetical protein VKT23_020324 [Stygiomarasmius scandens]|uniref:N2227-like protein n=1 Tax=Marasmiellus scandens TaxID=2682957 RepID=A0ABR1IJA6_9AGAR
MPRRVVRVLLLLIVVGVVAVLLPRSGPLSINLNVNVPRPVTVHIDNPSYAPNFYHDNSQRAIPKSSPASKTLSPKQHSILSAITSFAKYTDSQAIGYNTHFEDARSRARSNAKFLDKVADYARETYGFSSGDITDTARHEYVADFLAHVSRDWSSEGSQERATIFPPILDALKDGLAGLKGEKKVLVPGFGLGRLAHEIANETDYSVDACELDYGSIIAYNYLVNQTTTPFEHTVYPFITNWPFQQTAKGRFAPIRFPDVLPTSRVHLVEGDFLVEFPESEKYDAVVTLFFIDVSENIIDFLSNIHRLLKPGGLWINLGPFKWGPFSQLQLSAEEVLGLSEHLGFKVNHDSRRSIEAVYAHQVDSLLKYTYVTQFWTARKP